MLRGLLPLQIAGSLSTCKDDDPQPALLPAAQNGTNTMGCKIDGQNWRASVGVLFGPKEIRADIHRFEGKREFSVGGNSTSSINAPFDETSVSLLIEDLTGPRTYELFETGRPDFGAGSPSYGMFTEAKPYPGKDYITSLLHKVKIIITRMDTIRRIVSGTFELKARQLGVQKEVSVTDGRFDVKYELHQRGFDWNHGADHRAA